MLSLMPLKFFKANAVAFFVFASLGSANALDELSSQGGSYLLGTGPTLTQFTINPFDVLVPVDTLLIFNVGTATLPEAEIDNPTFTGNISYIFGSVNLPSGLYTMAAPWNAPPGELQWDLQNDTGGWYLDPQIYGPDHPIMEMRYIPIVAAKGATATIQLSVEVQNTIPEPGSMFLIGVGILAIFARILPKDSINHYLVGNPSAAAPNGLRNGEPSQCQSLEHGSSI